MMKYKIEDQETIHIRQQIAYEYRDEEEILFWELQHRFVDYNKRNTTDPIEYMTNLDLKEFRKELGTKALLQSV